MRRRKPEESTGEGRINGELDSRIIIEPAMCFFGHGGHGVAAFLHLLFLCSVIRLGGGGNAYGMQILWI